ncbi:MAG: DUF86 domain-containing protein [Gomphosphaeria aponina SAG 52.96 = DSM 107014]|uniref:DUF86 domain-containing protein n=1 Tax=Gomphosphaeria aponina SAG 52.96 = DSM 107014 TaxID=1521640 RepID=A0A941JRR0_9CHRO|nr:DUF86 domain-containing protein [Gomphosphaeria aponina SAG 52.96 = DSM 107014]
MPSRDWPLRINDILQSIAAIQQRIAGMTFEEFQKDETIIKAILYDFIIIGEASINVPAEIQFSSPNIPWGLMRDARNLIAHEYFRINLDVIWDIIRNDLPPLVPQLQNLLETEEGNNAVN